MSRDIVRKRFYSKKDLWLGILFGSIMVYYLLEIYKDIHTSPNIGTGINTLVIIFIGWFLFGTYYEFKDEYLLIKAGPLKDKLYYNDITNLNETKSLMASMALSIDRIEIIYNGRFYGHISPKYRREFLEKLESKRYNIQC